MAGCLPFHCVARPQTAQLFISQGAGAHLLCMLPPDFFDCFVYPFAFCYFFFFIYCTLASITSSNPFLFVHSFVFPSFTLFCFVYSEVKLTTRIIYVLCSQSDFRLFLSFTQFLFFFFFFFRFSTFNTYSRVLFRRFTSSDTKTSTF